MQNKNLKLIYQMIICTVHCTSDNVSELCMLMHYITFSYNSTNSFCRLLTKSSVENLAKVSASFFHKLCELKTFTFEPTMHWFLPTPRKNVFFPDQIDTVNYKHKWLVHLGSDNINDQFIIEFIWNWNSVDLVLCRISFFNIVSHFSCQKGKFSPPQGSNGVWELCHLYLLRSAPFAPLLFTRW